MSSKARLPAEDLWLVRLVVLLRAAKAPVSEESILAEFERRRIGGVTAPRIRKVLVSLAGKKLIREIKGSGAVFEATSQGRKAALAAGARLSALLELPDGRRS